MEQYHVVVISLYVLYQAAKQLCSASRRRELSSSEIHFTKELKVRWGSMMVKVRLWIVSLHPYIGRGTDGRPRFWRCEDMHVDCAFFAACLCGYVLIVDVSLLRYESLSLILR